MPRALSRHLRSGVTAGVVAALLASATAVPQATAQSSFPASPAPAALPGDASSALPPDLQQTAQDVGYDAAYSATGAALGSSLPSIGSSQVGAAAVDPNFAPAHVVDRRHLGGTEWEIDIYSPSNDLVIKNTMTIPDNAELRPSLILLPGLGGGENEHWSREADIPAYFGAKQVNVISVHGGAGSMFTDWSNPHPTKGSVAWSTYLGQELPDVLVREFRSNGDNAIAGISMSGGPALDIAGRFPETFDAAASLSGFPATSGVFGAAMVLYVTNAHGGSFADIWGPMLDPRWRDHDPAVTAHRLRDTAVYVGHANGKPSPIDRMNQNDPFEVTISEMMAGHISRYYVGRARATGIDVHYTVLPAGRHTYGVFETLLHDAWETTIGPEFGVE